MSLNEIKSARDQSAARIKNYLQAELNALNEKISPHGAVATNVFLDVYERYSEDKECKLNGVELGELKIKLQI